MRRVITILLMILLSTIVAQGQIKIGGNVYGGGNHANVEGSAKVTVKAGDIGAVMDPNAERPLADPQGKVFGGARMANVGGNTFVHIDGENATDFILINQVYGGNDIAGQIGTAAAVGEDVPTELTAIKRADHDEDADDPKRNAVDNTFNSYVRISTLATDEHYTEEEIAAASTNPEAAAYGKKTTDVKPDPAAKKIYIGQLFAGGNGDFDYEQTPGPEEGKVTHVIYNWSDKSHQYPIAQMVTDEGEVGFQLPELNKTYLEVKGGSIVYGYGGGNNATVREQNIIHFDNPSAVVNHILVTDGTGAVDAGIEADAATYAPYVASVAAGAPVIPSGYEELLTTERFKEMGINTAFSFPSSGAFQVGRFFGGNNKAEMHIRPTWNLLAGKIRNLYSGGNRGKMTSPEGLLLEIKDYSSLIVDNLYGGCRMADVMPTVNGVYTPCLNLDGYNFPNQLSARVLVKGGHINNVYGGNDVTGTVYGGNAVGIYTAVYGDVYGGGNGAYPYTNSESMKDDATYGDFYFEQGDYATATEALNAFRPNAEQVSLRLAGTEAKPTIIKGSIFVGGNCASLATKKEDPMVELKIGSYVIADKVFLGNNGEKMVDPTILGLYKENSSLVLTDESVFAEYMNGVALPLKPNVVFDSEAEGDPATYDDNTSMIGSFYGGGNKGSMMVSGKTTLKFDRKLIIFNKLVGGCNDADVEAIDGLCASYAGGLLGSSDEWASYTDGGKIKDRLELDLDNVLIEPKRWTDTFTKVPDGTTLTAGKEYYETDLHDTKFIAVGTEVSTTLNPYYELATVGLDLVWNTAKWDVGEDDFVSTGTTNSADDKYRRLLNGNVYGGCYNSGHVNGNVVININQDLIKRDVVFAEATSEDPYTISGARRTGVLKESQGDDVMAVAMTVFGAGCGAETEIWGSTTVNHNNGYTFQIFGGGEEGVVGNRNNTDENGYNAAYSSTVNLKGLNPGYSEQVSGLPLAEAEYLYGGGNEGDVLGDSYLYLGNGRVYDAFGGASNADIYGGAEVHIGYNGGFPWVKDNVYGGNDFGGTVRGNRNHYSVTQRAVFDDELKRSSTYVKYIQGRVDSIFGGNYGSYDYANRIFKDYTNADGSPKDGFSFPHLNDNSFVHFVPADNSTNQLNFIFGGSEGFPGHRRLNNSMQTETYVLIDDTQTKDANRFANVDIYGGGAFAGVGDTETSLGAGRTAVDLFAGSFNNVYGGCNQEGLVGYTRVNVPSASTAKVNALFGGGKGYDPALFVGDNVVLAGHLCDHYVTCIDFKGKDAIVEDAIYGGNENSRIACDTYINIEAPVMQSSGYQANVYGAGYGNKTVSGRTNVFMNNGSNAYKVFGGGRDGNAFNFASLRQWLTQQFRIAEGSESADVSDKVTAYAGVLADFGTYLAAHPISLPTSIGTYVNAEGIYDGTYTNDIVTGDYHQTNVHILNGGNVSGYAYGGGYGTDAVVAGSTYVELKGGNVDRDIFGGGEGGPVFDEFDLAKDEDPDNDFVATTNVNIEGGMARNVYGGGYLGHVGKHCKTVDGKIVEAAIYEPYAGDIPAVANVTIGKTDATSFYDGIPAIQRNVYGGGEGGSVYGTTNLTINNGYVGYRYKNTATSGAAVYEYVEELDDQKPNAIELAGNAFGGGYVVNSYVDHANVTMYGGTLRGSLYGGGEVGPIGRGASKTGLGKGGLENGDATIFRAGTTQVTMYGGKVLRNVFGGGRGKDSWGGDGTMYMDQSVVTSLKSDGLFCKGYVFGQTRVNIHGGEIGTDAGMAYGYGNVFGGGDEGTVYSAYMDGNNLRIGKKYGERYDGGHEGYYFEFDGTNYLTQIDGVTNIFTEDCKVVVEPHAQAKENVSITGGTGSPRGTGSYNAGEYVTTADLNRLKSKNNDSNWASLDDFGIIIHNAVFAGGNIAAGSSSLFANATTVYGNATASIHDVYNRDLITIGTGHTGGLYGDGNLTFVDGYRELNITNYGTDYYHIKTQLEYDEYKVLPEREKAYYELKYKCLKSCTDIEGTTYSVGTNLPMDELLALFTKPDGTSVQEDGNNIIVTVEGKKVPNSTYWQENGVVSIYAGRIMNTIQRADFCGVFGSRMVMKGARDRVPEVVDYTNYTINRVREVSLNKKTSIAGDTDENATHGNYFGIYSNVNFLGALTSDVLFSDVRTTNADTSVYPNLAPESANQTFYEWKQAHKDDKTRNNGTCHNHLALASGVYLELTTEKSTGNTLDTKDWGPITGVVELDLINVQTGIGGGFVYARNEHGKPGTGRSNTTLTALNDGAASKWNYTYDGKYNNWEEAEANKEEWQTSGNFIHSSQTIIDDCYNIGSKYGSQYKAPNGVPAHYWFIAGSVYVYDQYISAYTGSPNAYSETVEVPITINAASHGTMTLMDVQPNLYAFYSTYTDASNNSPLSGDQKLVINDVTYHMNDPISYWDWNKLPASEKKLFVADTYVLKDSCYINSKYYPAGYVMLPSEYNSLKSYAVDYEIEGENVKAVKKATKNAEGVDVVEKDNKGQDVYVAFDDAFRSSNNMSHTTGYLLTYNVTNPSVWDKWYTKIDSSTREKQQTDADGFEDGPTYHPTTTGLYGQQEYEKNAIISKVEYDKYNGYDANGNSSYTDIAEGDVYGLKQMYPAISSRDDQAVFTSAYLVTKEYTSASVHYYPGAPVAEEISGFTSPAYVSTATIQLSSTEYIYVNDLMTEAQKEQFKSNYPSLATEIEACVKPAYISTKAGLYGGSYYETGNNYRALEAYCAMSPTDREQFAFNYDALDLLIDPTYGGTTGRKYQYDSEAATVEGANSNAAHYSLATPIDYTATYKGESAMTYKDAENNSHTIAVNQELTSTVYETLPNEQHHYAPIKVDAGGGTYYVVKESFVHGETPYAVGATIDSSTFDRLTDSEKTNYITTLSFEESEVIKDGSGNPLPFYYCRESYTVNENGEGADVTKVKGEGNASYTAGGTVPVGFVINATNYSSLPNRQKNFTIHGVSPMETSTLYVARYADINDLSTEKIITVVYKYDYEESDKDGTHITPVSERHVVNIHITFKSGVPVVDDINPPTIVLPGTGITMRPPSVTPGAYEVTGGGWELFEKPSDAESHVNGVPYTPNEDPLYWYQDGFYLAYYAKTYLGKTYSNHVQVSVANYHDLKEVMDDTKYHLHVDYDRSRLKRESKIYINDYSGSSKNGLDLFKDFYDLSLVSASGDGYTVTDGKITAATGTANTNLVNHALLNTHETNGVKGGQNLEFFLRTDISHTEPWSTIGTDDVCFKGNLHGDGHTISGLNNSLFYNLCGSVYNLGVMGTFNSAGVVDKGSGYVESCWIKTSNETPLGTRPNAVFGDPTDTEGYQLVNSYFLVDNKDLYGNVSTNATTGITTSGGDRGKATAMSAKAYYNGELAYNLNNFYLYKRYSDKKVTSGTENQRYSYFTIGSDGKLVLQNNHYYDAHADLCSTGHVDKNADVIMYVEDRFADGDFRYDGGDRGVIPNTEDERLYTWTVTDNTGKETVESSFFPIYPDDYIFFGQKLTYGYAAGAPHQEVPTAVVRNEGRLSKLSNANRVYRAPAYFRSKEMGVAHFNPNAYLAQKEKDGSKEAYPGMTAIDFAGHNDPEYKLGYETAPWFYPSLLDDDGLLSIVNCDETKNLLVYAPAASAATGYANKATHDVLTGYFTDPAYSDYYSNPTTYRTVADATSTNATIYGHLVTATLTNGKPTATNDHLLVDKEDFNCPIAFQFDGTHRMWYQRKPEDHEYVDFTKGWQGISLPFTAELVTTDTKGEITHFYSGSEKSKNGTGTLIGNEYWLREFKGISEVSEKVNETTKYFAKGSFLYPTAEGSNKSVSNTFLWDYYYEKTDRKDKNSDIYQEYYRKGRSYTSYPLLSAATPYIIGLPGLTYYEFDLSGKFEAANTKVTIDKLDKQTISFVSDAEITINVSDDETKDGVQVEKSLDSTNKDYSFTFKPSYMNWDLEAGTNSYTLNTDGDRYDKVPAEGAATKVSAFRPYFMITATAKTPSPKMVPEYIVFGNDYSSMEGEIQDALDGSLEIYTKNHKIFTTSHLKEATTIRILNVAGVTYANYVLQPGETIETRVNNSGVYIVRAASGHYTKKVSVK